MLLISSVLAVTFSTGTIAPSVPDSSFINKCLVCHQETVYMPDIPNPEMTFSTEPIAREIALAPNDPALTYYVPLQALKQQPSITNIFDLSNRGRTSRSTKRRTSKVQFWIER